MKINNCLDDCPDYFLQRLVSFCCKELDLPVHYLKKVAFYKTRKTRHRRHNGHLIPYPAFSGRAYLHGKAISVRVSPDNNSFPCDTKKHRCGLQITLADRVEALVFVTAHEVAHHEQYMRKVKTRKGGGNGGCEADTDRFALQVLRKYRENKDLLAEWSKTPVVLPKQQPTTVEKREQNVRELLEKWERKLKFVKTKIAKYRKKVAYYDRKNIAATKNP